MNKQFKHQGKFSLCLLLLGFIFIFNACRSTKHTQNSVDESKQKERNQKTELLIKTAKSYLGTNYKAGGIDKHGIDCSGLVFTSFHKIDINLPRKSIDQSTIGKQVQRNNAEAGDLIFFATGGKAKGINHVGIVTSISDDAIIHFIHSSLKAGVVEDNLAEPYYRDSFVKIMRIY